ncbi:ABC transporter substrate-binding protein [Marinivivus vitaminiproducens]|uniref:ABC transporter substrate-binding protein n=1 Tax=Marinivivus vitaminiproducens TaxID=3035935 RepID=UPI0027984978|nr:ABC transporter substrate-binding protein [Geminicoccaceae bacterium SCSIO 64248]
MNARLLARLAFASLLLLAQPAAAQDKLTLLLEWYVNPDHAPIVLAQELGYFGEEGLEVEIVPPADPSDPPKLVAAGQADIGVSYQPQLHIQVDQGLPLVRIGTLVATPLNTIMVLEDGPVQSLADLEGRRVGYSVSGVETALLDAMLAGHGLSSEDVEMVNVNFALSPALMSRQVDAVIGAYRNVELVQLEEDGVPGRAFFVEEEGVPAYDELIFIANRDRLDDPRLPRFLRAIERATAYMVNHPDEARRLFIESNPDLDNEHNRRSFDATLPRFAHRPFALDRGRYESFAAFLAGRGLIAKPAELASYAVELPRP